MANSSYGIRVAESSDGNLLQNNNITQQNDDGIAIDGSAENAVAGNNFTQGQWIDVWLRNSPNNTISENRLTSAQSFYFYNSSQNLIYHNSIMNIASNVTVTNSTNIWDNGYPSGGNYWSFESAVDLKSGPYQNIAGSDGICDTPFVIDDQNIDNYPLTYPF